jgi:catechol-2,3-dioxygenase
MLQFNHIDHLNFTVQDLDKSSQFYQEIFGFKVFEASTHNESPYQILGLSGRGMLCLYENKVKGFSEEANQGSRLNHVGFNIQFYDGIVEDLESKNVKVRYYDGEAIIQYPKSKSIYISDPDGNEIELSELFGGGL